MSIGIFGYIAIFLSLFAIKKKDNCLLLAIFFASFCESSVLSFSTFVLQPGHYFLFLFLGLSLIYTMVYLAQAKGNDVVIVKPDGILTLFIVIAILSVLFSLIFRIDILVYGIGNDNQLKSSLVSSQNFTQLIYLICGFMLYWSILNYCALDEKKWKRVVSVLCLSGIIIMFIGIYQMIAYNNGLPFDEIFRNNAKEMWQTKERVQSTMGEASFLGQYCIYLISIFIGFKWIDNFFLRSAFFALVLLVGILTRSTTFLLGLIAIFIAFVLFQQQKASNILKTTLFIIVTVIVSSLFLKYSQSVQLLVESALNKFSLESYSGVERSFIYKHMLNVGLKYPIFGIGYGGGRSTDLYANLLATTGFAGFTTFILFIMNQLIVSIKFKSDEGSLMCLLLIIGFLVTSWSIPDINYLPFWTVMAVLDSHSRLVKGNKLQVNT